MASAQGNLAVHICVPSMILCTFSGISLLESAQTRRHGKVRQARWSPVSGTLSYATFTHIPLPLSAVC